MMPLEQRYKRAEQLLPWNLAPRLKNLSLRPYWLDDYRFWFKRDLVDGYEFILVDTDELVETTLFDHKHVATALTELLGEEVMPDKLPIRSLIFDGNSHLCLDLEDNFCQGKSVNIDLDSYGCVFGTSVAKANAKSSGVSATSPSGRLEVLCHDNNLALRFRDTDEEIILTEDGEPHFGYGSYSDYIRVGIGEEESLQPAVRWSYDERYLAVQRIDERQVREMPLQQSVSKNGSVRPSNHPYKFAMPGDKHIALASLCVIDLDTGAIICSDRPKVSASGGGYMDLDALCWGTDNVLYHTEWSRDRQLVRFVAFEPSIRESRVLLEEKNQDHSFLHSGPMPFEITIFKVVPEINEFIWYSHRSGWGHLYRYDLTTGKLKNPITSGDYVVTHLHYVDIDQRCLYFSACGLESNRNPYYEHLYRINLDGDDLILLTPEDCQHDISPPCFLERNLELISNSHGISKNGNVFIDTLTRPDQAPRSFLRSTADGSRLMGLSRGDFSLLNKTPYTSPLSFTTKASDGVTDVWGVIHKPSYFDKEESYPVVLAIYGGPHICVTPKRFGEFEQYVGKVARTLAELGLIVVTLDPRGTPYRSKVFQGEVYGNIENGGGIDDQIAALHQLAERYAWMDLNKVGVTGHSNGGFASARAILTNPEFFQVAVSSAGVHDHRGYEASWGESFQGLLKDDNYKAQSNLRLATNLKGKLLLVHGDMDGNVHVSQTMRLVDQLIKHNKNFDMLILPNRRHSYMEDTYFIRRVWDYFAEHLLNETPPDNYCIQPPTR